MSTKRAATRPPATRPPGSAKRPPSAKDSARLNRAFARRFRTTVAILVALTGVLAAANLAQESEPNATSALENAPAGSGFEIYALERSTGLDSTGKKTPDTIRGENITDKNDGSGLVSAPRIQEYAALPSALAAVTINENNTSSLEVISFSGGPSVQVPLPKPGTVENLHAGPKNLIGFSFTSAPITDRYWKKLFIYEIDSPSAPPKEVRGIDGTPLSVKTWTFVPGTASIGAQTDVGAMFLIDAPGDGKVTPLGLHAEMGGFIPGTQQLHLADRSPKPATIRGQNSTTNLADGKLTPFGLPENPNEPNIGCRQDRPPRRPGPIRSSGQRIHRRDGKLVPQRRRKKRLEDPLSTGTSLVTHSRLLRLTRWQVPRRGNNRTGRSRRPLPECPRVFTNTHRAH